MVWNATIILEGGFKIKRVTPYHILLFVLNMQSMKVNSKLRPSLLS